MKGFTLAELHELPVTVDLLTAARALGLGRTKAYELAKKGEFPCRVIRVGVAYLVPTAELLKLLAFGFDGVVADDPPPPGDDSQHVRVDTGEFRVRAVAPVVGEVQFVERGGQVVVEVVVGVAYGNSGKDSQRRRVHAGHQGVAGGVDDIGGGAHPGAPQVRGDLQLHGGGFESRHIQMLAHRDHDHVNAGETVRGRPSRSWRMAVQRGEGAEEMGTAELTTLWRPTGPEELELVERSGLRAWPPRLPEQPIFYPVLNEDYAIKIARDWNVPHSGVGYVTRFQVSSDFLARYPVRQAGGRDILELWVPAEELAEFNEHIVGLIEVVHEFRRDGAAR